MSNPVWCVMPVLAGPEMTEAALSDLLAQSVPTRVLVVNQGVDDAFRDRLERLAEGDDRIVLWSHLPPLPSLSATWNRALDYVLGDLGEPCALVVNNDVRLLPETIAALVTILRDTDALFVSAVGVSPAQYETTFAATAGQVGRSIVGHLSAPVHQLLDDGTRGGPDFSCFLIGADCHQAFRFDERFIPAFCEDLDYHRRLMLAGEGSRIFSVNLPYLHLASQTLKQVDPAQAQAIRASIEHHARAYYQQKWGGPVNAETFLEPFGGGHSHPTAVTDGSATTPHLQALGRNPPIDQLAREMLALGEIDRPQDQGCRLPPPGWYCSRTPGHEGPCAARPTLRPLEEPHGEDARRVEADRRPDPPGETPGSTECGVVPLQPGDR